MLDKVLFIVTMVLLSFGIVMVASAATAITEHLNLVTFHYAKSQALYVFFGLIVLFLFSCIPIKFLEKYNILILIVSILLLMILLVPGVGRQVNGSLRWLMLGSLSLQPSEVAKLALIMYIAGYIARRNYQIKNSFLGFIIPMIVLSVIALLLMLEPDFGAVVVLASTILGMLFLAGVKVRSFIILLPPLLCVLSFLAISSSYRVQRLIIFRDPWADQFDAGYQLVQSLIAFGRGSWFGVGLGKSLQKMLYLPEAHTDFIFAVIAEELGLLGACLILALYTILIVRAMQIGKLALKYKQIFSANLAYGIALLISLQVFINVGVNVGLLPTKGLTLPLISAGGCSLLVTLAAIGILLRIYYEISLFDKKL